MQQFYVHITRFYPDQSGPVFSEITRPGTDLHFSTRHNTNILQSTKLYRILIRQCHRLETIPKINYHFLSGLESNKMDTMVALNRL